MDFTHDFRRDRAFGADFFDGSVDQLVAGSPAMRNCVDLAAQAAASQKHAFIVGESGTGKKTLAVAIHRSRAAPRGSLVIESCGAIPATLQEQELLRSASSTRPAALEAARGGTLVLSYAEGLIPEVQRQIAAVLAPRPETRRDPIQLVITAANPGEIVPELAVALGAIRIDLPPLRERGDDIRVLASRLFRHHTQRMGIGLELTAGALDSLARRSWPGNVRELSIVIHCVLLLAHEAGRTEVVANDLLGT